MRFNIPIYITIFRLITIPFFTFSFYIQNKNSSLFSAVIFFLGAITDWFDGFLARKTKKITKFGTFLDPVVDKIIVITALTLILEFFHTVWITIPITLLIIREIIVSALRQWAAYIGKSKKIKVSFFGKIKTTSQMLSIIILLWNPNYRIQIVGIFFLYFTTIIAFFSMMYYFFLIRKDLCK
ncbi:CDP-diacylglycerol--glycerol-3-phosphate 3-phosphatidyltransferase [bacterium endosymbiont of Pedicinus badii]|uniref:CDP-diacylglycerol--glycerol-3-phosphate 3-phosphatidyltransferase n=1 Tax=bacterium endosymbiont of Pedicinus badii TaxID=1719126 RepID=UPI0009B97299|nr:CDP-diacylglycerol--glycerol-3-phosphate 3-phosphatidyltransferase [bacterium endosymbiont of Pedicinus badii]OQM34356.1 CDP-diacylglycerol--glycerol-3-phosphate 3-phosphatidyltransferase [bacterium endosymbiont of Pedicinus badii]